MRAAKKCSAIGILASVIWATACGVPASPSSPGVNWSGPRPADGGVTVARELDVGLTTRSQLGSGWNAVSSSVRAACATGTIQRIPSADAAQHRFARPFSGDEAAALGPHAMGPQRFDLTPDLQPPEWQDPLALRLLYGVEWRTAREAFAPGTESLMAPPDGAGFRSLCGDAYYGQADLGGRLLLELGLHFATRAAHDDFLRLVGEAPAMPAGPGRDSSHRGWSRVAAPGLGAAGLG